MKIAFIITPSAVISGASNGIKSQALSYQSILINAGHDVELINTWGNYNFEDFDVIHIFGNGNWIYPIVKRVSKKNSNIFVSPIIDSNIPNWIYKIYSFIGLLKLNISTPTYSLRKASKYINSYVVRSDYEFKKVELLSGSAAISKVGLVVAQRENINLTSKEDFCLHVSSIYQKRKNVIRLIKASKKFGFKLILAGSVGSKEQYQKIQEEIGDNPNVLVKGFVSEDELHKLYKKAKVFALPSLREGVGIVALDAASYGCKIVITSRGGCKEYYTDNAIQVNPRSTDEIGKAISQCLLEENNTVLKDYLNQYYSTTVISTQLLKVYDSKKAKLI